VGISRARTQGGGVVFSVAGMDKEGV